MADANGVAGQRGWGCFPTLAAKSQNPSGCQKATVEDPLSAGGAEPVTPATARGPAASPGRQLGLLGPVMETGGLNLLGEWRWCMGQISHPRAGIWGPPRVGGGRQRGAAPQGAAAVAPGPQGPPRPSRPLPALGAGWRPAQNSSGVGFRSGRCSGRGRKMPGRGDRPREHPPAARVSQLLVGTQPGAEGGLGHQAASVSPSPLCKAEPPPSSCSPLPGGVEAGEGG